MPQDIKDLDSFGVLVGWTHTKLGQRLDLRLQTVKSTRHEGREVLDSHHFMMTPSQAAVLANYLLRITEQTAPRARRGYLQRWFGS